MRDVAYSEYLKNTRQIGARATFTDTLLRFDALFGIGKYPAVLVRQRRLPPFGR